MKQLEKNPAIIEATLKKICLRELLERSQKTVRIDNQKTKLIRLLQHVPIFLSKSKNGKTENLNIVRT